MTEVPKTVDLFAIIIFLGVVQGLFLSIFFLNKRVRKKPSNLYLGFLMLILSLVIGEIFLVHTGYMYDILRFNNFSEPITFGIAPLMYFYIYSSISKKKLKRAWLHLLPMLMWALYSIWYYMQPLELKQLYYLAHVYPEQEIVLPEARYNDDPLGIRKYVLLLSMLQLTLYISASLIYIGQSFKALGISFFARGGRPVSWLRNFILLMILVLVAAGIANSFAIVDMGMYIVGSICSFFIYATSFNVVRASDFFQESATDPFSSKKKYEKSTLPEEEKSRILKQLKIAMEEDKDYRSHLLSLGSVAKKLGSTSHHISQVINEKMDMSFYEMIAKYRIDESKSILGDPSNTQLTIEDVADDVGYNSKSAFNRSFKKIEGLTPSEYREKSVKG